MVTIRQIWITALLAFCQLFCMRSTQRCGSEYSTFGMMLQYHTFKEMKASIGTECVKACNEDVRCQSFNYVISQDTCEFNNRTKEARPEDFVPNFDRYYYRRVRKRGKKLKKKSSLLCTAMC